MQAFLSVCLLLLAVFHTGFSVFLYQPEQVHLSYGDSIWEFVVTWSTYNDTPSSVVEYGIGGFILQANGKSVPFTSSGPEKRQQFIHSVKLASLLPGQQYVYHCGSDLGWSDKFMFTTPPSDPDWSPQVAMFGDMGNKNAQSVPRLQEETQRGMYDAILHIGDFGYDLDYENGRVGDAFLNTIQPIAAYVPYMTCPGNHESANNFSEYRNRFNMPSKHGFMYSFNMGPIHFVSISTEVYYYLEYGIKEVVTQYEWLENDLKEASSVANRTLRPWIIVFGHRPMYCSNNDHDDCTQHETRVRIGLPFLRWFGIEPLLFEHGVDLAVWAHEHSYERLWPLYDYKIYNGSYEEPYRNPGAPVHITSGSAGCQEGRDDFVKPRPAWSAFSSSDYGYMRLKAYNFTHLYMEQVSDDKQGQVIDHTWLIKDKHGPYETS